MARFYKESRECPREIPSNDVFLFLKIIVEYMEDIMSALSDLQAQVAANVDAEASAVTLIQGIAQQLKDALAASGNSDPALLDLAAKLHASADALGAAVLANTAPVVVPPVVVPPVVAPVSAEPAPAAPADPVPPVA